MMLALRSVLQSAATTLSTISLADQNIFFPFAKQNSLRKYDSWEAYGQSKTANILMAVHLAAKIPSHEIASFSVNPGGE